MALAILPQSAGSIATRLRIATAARWSFAALRFFVQFLFISSLLAVGSAAVVIWFDRLGGVRLLGGLMPGMWLGAGLFAAVALTLVRHARVPRPDQRKRRLDWKAANFVGPVFAAARLLLLGALLGALMLRSLHPVRANFVYVIVDVSDPINDAAFRRELLDTAVQIIKDNAGRHVEFVGTERIGELVRLAADDRMTFDDPRWWEELKQQPSLNERLAELEQLLANRFGEAVYVVSVNKPSGKVSPWPPSPERVVSRWYCVDPSQAPRADRTQLVSYSAGQDPAAAPYFYATLSVKPGDPVPLLRVQVTGEPVRKVPHAGRFGDFFGFHAVIPRDKDLVSIDFERPDGSAVPIDALRGLKLEPRRLKVKLGPGLEQVKQLPFLKEKDGPIEFVDANPDVVWEAGKSSAPATLLPTVELLFSPNDYASAPAGYQLRRTPAYLNSALGSVGLPSAGAEFRDLSQGLGLTGTVLIALSRDAGDELPVVLHRAPAQPRWVTVVLPRPDQFPQMTGNVPKSAGQLLVWATSLARREGRPEPPPMKTATLVDRPDGVEMPIRSGLEPIRDGLGPQILAGLRGRLDGNRPLSADNSLRLSCGQVAWSAVAALLAITVVAAAVEAFFVRRARPVR
jgi:hypothetical protein